MLNSKTIVCLGTLEDKAVGVNVAVFNEKHIADCERHFLVVIPSYTIISKL